MRGTLAIARPQVLLLSCLAVSTLLSAVLAWQAFSAAASSRSLADGVLRDYADLAATELARRSTNVIGTYGIGAAARGLQLAFRDPHGSALPARAAVEAATPAGARRSGELIGTRFIVDPRERRVMVEDGSLPAAAEEALIAAAQRSKTGRSDYTLVQPRIADATRTFVLAAARPDADAVRLGFELRTDRLAGWFTDFILQEPLLPPTLSAQQAAAAALHVSVRDPDGHAIFMSGDVPPPGSPSARRELTAPGGSSLDGFTVEAAIDPAAADRLVIGGVPQSRLGLLLSLLALSGGLTWAAAVQVRRERALTMAREDFVAKASHELKTPVARVRMFTETLLLDRVRSDAERRQALEALDRAARRLSFSVDNILRFSAAATANAAELHLEEVDLSSLVRDIVQEAPSTLGHSGAIELRGPAGADAKVDRDSIRHVLFNLLDNAAKYSRGSAGIRVDLRRVGGDWQIAVEDRGPGVPENERERVWQPYYRIERDRRSSTAGTGIGLAVVRDLVSRHGGRSWIEANEGGGTRVIVTVPAASPERAPK